MTGLFVVGLGTGALTVAVAVLLAPGWEFRAAQLRGRRAVRRARVRVVRVPAGPARRRCRR